MSSTYILPLVERAAVAFLGAQTYTQEDSDHARLDSNRIVKGFQRAETIEEEPSLPLPVAICSCLTANNDEDIYTGNWVADLTVELRTKVFETSSDAHQAMAEELFAFLCDSTIAASLTAALSGFTAFLVVPGNQTRAIETNCWISRMQFAVHCCGQDIS